MKFSICLIMRNEAKVLPRLLNSLKEYKDRGGDINCLDTGSTDDSVKIAKEFGCKVKEVGEIYRKKIDNYKDVNDRFLVDGEEDIIKEGDSYFDFSSARNECVNMASRDFVFFYDADEVSVNMNIDKINSLIEEGMTQAEYNFVFSYDIFGQEAIKFVQCKAYDRRYMKWEGIIHELVVPYNSGPHNKVYLSENIYKLGHHQNIETGRHSYLKGLAVDCFNHPENDRHSHYLARELYWNGRLKSALKEFERHIKMGGWHAEKAESYLYMGDIYGSLNKPSEQVTCYAQAFHVDSSRNAPLLKLAQFYNYNKNYQAAICYAKASLEIKHTGFYADNAANYREIPHEILYNSYGWIGNIEDAKKHLLCAIDYLPYNTKYLDDTKFYFEYTNNKIDGWMTFRELQFLYNLGKKYNLIAEVGSWKGRSSHAIASGQLSNKGILFCIDTWQGSKDIMDSTNWMAKEEDIFSIFSNNIKEFDNIIPIKSSSIQASKDITHLFDAVFIDAGHTREEVINDIKAWLPHATKFICGHDYKPDVWMGVVEAVDEIFGKPDGVEGTIWWVDLEKRQKHLKEESIPKKIYTVWLGDNIPNDIEKMVESQKIDGYEHKLFTLDNLPKGHKYLDDAIAAKKWVKAVDWLRMYILETEGGIFMDADVEIVKGKNFDDLLSSKMIVGREKCDTPDLTILGTAIVGSVPNHPLVKKWRKEVESKFKGDDSLNYESSMDLLNVLGVDYQDIMTILPQDYLYPYDHKSNTYNITDNTICIHHFLKSWVLPKVSIIIPQLGREEGLKKCLKSIDELNYPRNLIEVIIEDGMDTVPVKVDNAYKKCNSDYIVYAANDMEFDKECLSNAIKCANDYGLVSFNSGDLLPDNGNICEHFLIKRDLINKIGGKIFDTRFHHVGCDNYLWHLASSLNQATRCENAIIKHNHFSNNNDVYDWIYHKGWIKVEEDRLLLKNLTQ